MFLFSFIFGQLEWPREQSLIHLTCDLVTYSTQQIAPGKNRFYFWCNSTELTHWNGFIEIYTQFKNKQPKTGRSKGLLKTATVRVVERRHILHSANQSTKNRILPNAF